MVILEIIKGLDVVFATLKGFILPAQCFRASRYGPVTAARPHPLAAAHVAFPAASPRVNPPFKRQARPAYHLRSLPPS